MSKTCSMYVRVKRQNQTIFLHVEPTDAFALVKEKLGTVLKMDPEKLRLIHCDREKVFEDEATIGDQEVSNDDIMYVVFKKGESNDFESISVGGGGKEGGQ